MESKCISDYRIRVKFNAAIEIILLIDTVLEPDEFKKAFIKHFPNKNLELEFIYPEDLKVDGFYKRLFDATLGTSSKLLHVRRRLNNLLSDVKIEKEISTPVITFYSYKGGVGRTTTLAAFAAHYAIHERKTVFLIDCDFEAPGITNFFGLQPTDEKGSGAFSKNGVVEYLSDREFLGDENHLNLDDYVISVPKDYSGEGEIYIVPAGNLSSYPIAKESDDTHLDHYLEGLSRLNFSGTEQIVEQFSNLLKHIEKQYKPDVILIDSRTGFNDIFANIGLSLSNIIIGFFSGNYQTIPGLNFVMSNPMIRNKLILVNSIISSSSDHKNFQLILENEVIRNIPNISEEFETGIKSFPVFRNRLWELLGTYSEDKGDFIRFINNKSSEYLPLFEEITYVLEQLDYIHEDNQSEDTGLQSQNDVDTPQVQSEQIKDEFKTEEVLSENALVEIVVETKTSVPVEQSEQHTDADDPVYLRETILRSLKEHLPVLYAEQDEHDQHGESFFEKQFYLRNCMFDIFSKDRFLICGAKGTGKTFLYKTLSTQKNFLDLLKVKNNEQDNYTVINVISLKANHRGEAEPQKYLELDTFPPSDYENRSDFFFKRFWLVYTWNAIFLSREGREEFRFPFLLHTELDNNEELKPQALKNESSDRKRFLALMTDENIRIIEEDLRALDAQLKQHNLKLMLTYDQLDGVIKPNLWSSGIAPLINYWSANTFSNIYPKLFVRRDLFDKLGNINNIQSLRNEICMLNLDWKKEEIFGVLFKLVFAYTKTLFFHLMELYTKSPDRKIVPTLTTEDIRELRLAIGKDNQIKQEERFLRPLVENFFGKRVETGGKPVESYDWFYINLCNADRTISLRPFLDLMKYAIENYFNNAAIHNKYPMPILAQRDFTYGEVRKNAVKNHFNDLASEAGNEKLKLFFSYIQLHAPSRLRKSFLTKQELNELIGEVQKTYPEEILKDSNRNSSTPLTPVTVFEEIRLLLLSNGIVRQIPSSGGYVNYSFAFLYKYHLGLSSKRTGYY